MLVWNIKRTSHLEHFPLGNIAHPGYWYLPFFSPNSSQWSHPSFLTDLFGISTVGPIFFLALEAASTNIEGRTLLHDSMMQFISLLAQTVPTKAIPWFIKVVANEHLCTSCQWIMREPCILEYLPIVLLLCFLKLASLFDQSTPQWYQHEPQNCRSDHLD